MPRYKCKVLNCANISMGMKKNQVSFHAFPQNPEICKEWVVRCGQPKPFCTNRSRICSMHFTEKDYDDSLGSKSMRTRSKVLNKDCVPTLFLPDIIEITSAKEKSVVKRRKKIEKKEKPFERPVEKPEAIMESNACGSPVKGLKLKFVKKISNRQGTPSTTVDNSAYVLQSDKSAKHFPKRQKASQKLATSTLASSSRPLSPLIGEHDESPTNRSVMISLPVSIKGFGTQSRIAAKQVQADASISHAKDKSLHKVDASAPQTDENQLKKAVDVPAPVENLPIVTASTSQTPECRPATSGNRSRSFARSSNATIITPQAAEHFMKVVANQSQALENLSQAVASVCHAFATSHGAAANRFNEGLSNGIEGSCGGAINLSNAFPSSSGASTNLSPELSADQSEILSCSMDRELNSLKRKLLIEIVKNSKLKKENENLQKQIAEKNEDAHN